MPRPQNTFADLQAASNIGRASNGALLAKVLFLPSLLSVGGGVSCSESGCGGGLGDGPAAQQAICCGAGRQLSWLVRRTHLNPLARSHAELGFCFAGSPRSKRRCCQASQAKAEAAGFEMRATSRRSGRPALRGSSRLLSEPGRPSERTALQPLAGVRVTPGPGDGRSMELSPPTPLLPCPPSPPTSPPPPLLRRCQQSCSKPRHRREAKVRSGS